MSFKSFKSFLSEHTFTLCSGLECTITELGGKQFRILSKKVKGETHTDRLTRMLASIIVEIGGTNLKNMNTDAAVEVVKGLFANDRKHILVEARQFSLDFEPDFKFEYEFADGGTTFKESLSADLSDTYGHFPVTPMKKQFNALYSDGDKWVELILPRSEVKVKFNPLDGKGESIGANTKDPDYNMLFTMRRCQYLDTDAGEETGKGVWVSLNPEQLNQRDYAFLFNAFKEYEGSVDVEMKFKHPKAAELGLTGADAFIIVNLLEVDSFFFPADAGTL